MWECWFVLKEPFTYSLIPSSSWKQEIYNPLLARSSSKIYSLWMPSSKVCQPSIPHSLQCIFYIAFISIYSLPAKAIAYKELQNYSSSNFESSIRQNAIDAILLINPKDEVMLKNLINATTHFKWQFSKYAKDQIRRLLKNNELRMYFDKIMLELNQAEQIQLKKLL